MKIRKATVADAEAAVLVLRRSIIELCRRDHENDPALLSIWLANKTAEKFRDWVEAEDSLCLVAVDGNGTILGVGLMSKAGVIRLNYASPEARFKGVSTALIGTLEAEALRLGVPHLTLNSTVTAHRFYLARGFKDAGEPAPGRLAGYPMMKPLSQTEG